MGQKIATEQDFWMCSGGLMPVQLQSVQVIARQKNDKKYLTVGDTSTSPNGDFICRKLMLLMAVIVAVVAVLIVATGGAALGAIVAAGAVAGAAGAAGGAALGALICGQKAALVRIWGQEKSNFLIGGQKTLTTGSQMECPIFGDKIVIAPHVKNWFQAVMIGLGNFGSEVIMGAMAGALIGVGGAVLAGEAAVVLPTWSSVISNLWASISGWGTAARVFFGANQVQNDYAMGRANSEEELEDSFTEGALPEISSVKRIVTGQAEPTDALLLLYFLHLKAPAKTAPRPEEKAPAEKTKEGEANKGEKPVEEAPAEKTKEGEANKGEEPVAKTQEKPAPNEEPAKPGEDGKAYEKGGALSKEGKTAKEWTQIDELDGPFNEHSFATYYDVRVNYQTCRERVGVAFEKGGILEFHLNVPERLQKQGLGSEIFRKAIADYLPSKVKGWWKTSDIYTGGESVNLKIFKEQIQAGKTPVQAAFETPSGKILKTNGFDGVPEIIKNTGDEVIIYFNQR